ncbi:MAG: hypothetical protein ACOVOR_05285 [Rhabdochlamydiaceae bacterium]
MSVNPSYNQSIPPLHLSESSKDKLFQLFNSLNVTETDKLPSNASDLKDRVKKLSDLLKELFSTQSAERMYFSQIPKEDRFKLYDLLNKMQSLVNKAQTEEKKGLLAFFGDQKEEMYRILSANLEKSPSCTDDSELQTFNLSEHQMNPYHLRVLLTFGRYLKELNLSGYNDIKIAFSGLFPAVLGKLKKVNLSSSSVDKKDFINLLKAAPHLEEINLSNCSKIISLFESDSENIPTDSETVNLSDSKKNKLIEPLLKDVVEVAGQGNCGPASLAHAIGLINDLADKAEIQKQQQSLRDEFADKFPKKELEEAEINLLTSAISEIGTTNSRELFHKWQKAEKDDEKKEIIKEMQEFYASRVKKSKFSVDSSFFDFMARDKDITIHIWRQEADLVKYSFGTGETYINLYFTPGHYQSFNSNIRLSKLISGRECGKDELDEAQNLDSNATFSIENTYEEVLAYSFRTLKKLDLSSSFINKEDLLKLLEKVSCIEELNLSNCPNIKGAFSNYRGSSLSNLKKIDLSNSSVSLEDLIALVILSPCVERVVVESCETVNELKTFNLTKAQMNASQLSVLLTFGQHLEELDVSDCRDIKTAFRALSSNALPQLKKVNLPSSIDNEDYSKLLEAAPLLKGTNLFTCSNIRSVDNLRPVNSSDELIKNEPGAPLLKDVVEVMGEGNCGPASLAHAIGLINNLADKNGIQQKQQSLREEFADKFPKKDLKEDEIILLPPALTDMIEPYQNQIDDICRQIKMIPDLDEKAFKNAVLHLDFEKCVALLPESSSPQQKDIFYLKIEELKNWVKMFNPDEAQLKKTVDLFETWQKAEKDDEKKEIIKEMQEFYASCVKKSKFSVGAPFFDFMARDKNITIDIWEGKNNPLNRYSSFGQGKIHVNLYRIPGHYQSFVSNKLDSNALVRIKNDSEEVLSHSLDQLKKVYVATSSTNLEYLIKSLEDFPDREEIDLSHCHIKDVFFNYSGPALSKLKKIDLSNSNITATELVYLFRLASSLTELHLEGCEDIQIGDFEGLQKEDVSQLKILNVSKSTITDVQLKTLLSRILILEQLDVSYCCNIKSLFSLISPIVGRFLRKINLSSCSVSHESLLKLFKMSYRLEEIDLSHCHIKEVFSNHSGPPLSKLKKIDLSNSNITATELVYLFRLASSLTELHLEGCEDIKIGDFEGLQKKDLSQLKILNVSKSAITDVQLKQLLNCAEGLKELDVNGCTKISNAFSDLSFKGLGQLEKVDLSSSSVHRNDIIKLLKAAPDIEELNLSHCLGVKDVFYYYSSAGSLPKLKKIDFSYSNVTLIDLTFLLANQPPIEELYLEGCEDIQIGDFEDLQKEDLSQLKILNVSKSAITDVQLKQLLNCAEGLKELDVNGCTKISNAFSDLSFKGLGQLEKVDLSSSSVHRNDIIKLLKAAPDIEELYLEGCEDIQNGDFEGLQKEDLSQLKILNVSKSAITDVQLKQLLNCAESLKELDISNCVNIKTAFSGLSSNALLKLDKLHLSGLSASGKIAEFLEINKGKKFP